MLGKCNCNAAIWTRVSIDVDERNQKDNRATYNEGDLFKVTARFLGVHAPFLINFIICMVLILKKYQYFLSLLMYPLVLSFTKLSVCTLKGWLLSSIPFGLMSLFACII